MKHAYKDVDFRPDTLALIETLNVIVDEYLAQGFVLTVRQLYYQCVARGHIENTERSYKRLASIINDARIAGLIDWDAIEDRTRELAKRQRWNSPSQILETVAETYHEDMWVGQPRRVFAIVEKEALAGVLTPVCRRYDVPLLPARGYPSSTVLREIVESDFLPAVTEGQDIVVLHLGDHDPSGIDMSRDLQDRFLLFGEDSEFRSGLRFERIALNMPQIEEQKPPENPAKVTDSRFADYVKHYGKSSWELDALSPTYLANLVESHITPFIDRPDLWKKRADRIALERKKLVAVAEQWA